MRISWASTKSNKNVKETQVEYDRIGHDYLSAISSVSVHVTFITLQKHAIISEETLRNMFSPYGNISDVIIKQPTKPNVSSSRGYGFVHFEDTPEGLASATKAVEELGNVTTEHVNYVCSMSRHYATPPVDRSAANGEGLNNAQSQRNNHQAAYSNNNSFFQQSTQRNGFIDSRLSAHSRSFTYGSQEPQQRVPYSRSQSDSAMLNNQRGGGVAPQQTQHHG
eukprot:gene31630-39072_t